MKLRAYPRYKDSGLEWLGEVPKHWEVKRLMHLTDQARPIMYGIVLPGPDVDDGVPIVKGGDVKPGRLTLENLCRTTPEIEAGYVRSRLMEGDIVFSIRGTVGEAEVVPAEITGANLTQDAARISTGSRVLSGWLLYSVKAKAIVDPLLSLSLGAAVRGVNIRDLKRVEILVPPTNEQRRVVEYLERETAKIDTLVEKKRTLIERLKEKRTALISRTVTRGLPADASRAAGLDPHPKLKPSGIEWLGDVPAHWNVAQLRRSSTILDCMHRTVPFVEEGVPLASIGEVHSFEVDLSNAKQTTEEEYLALLDGGRKPQHGDIIYSRNATVGEAAIVTTNERFAMGQDVCLIRSKSMNPKYMLYLIQSEPLAKQLDSVMIGATFRRVNVGQIKNFWICHPPPIEQQWIGDFLDRETLQIDQMVTNIETAIERLQEYRSALITAAVTGKIDVRNTGANA